MASIRITGTLVVAALCILAGASHAQPAEPPPVGESVVIEHGDSRLHGSVLVPAGPGPHPAVVAIEGSGDSSYRYGWTDGYFPFWKDFADSLVARGYAVLLYDKPGVNESTGDWRRQSFDDRAEEVMAALHVLAERDDVDATRISVVGHSQGGWVAQLVAAQYPQDVAFLVTLAGPAVSVKAQIIDDVESSWACDEVAGLGLAARKAGLQVGLGALGAVAHVAKPGYLSHIIHFDPRDVLPRIKQPMLAIFAGYDPLVPPEVNRSRLVQYYGSEHEDARLLVATVPGADHFFRASARCPQGSPPGEWAPRFHEVLLSAEFWAWVEEGAPARPQAPSTTAGPGSRSTTL